MVINGNFLDLVGAFFAGVLVSLTPCVYPLVPVTAAAIAGANIRGSRRTGFFLSLVYVLGMALVYAGLAMAAAMTGTVFGVVQNTPLFMAAVALVFLFFALVMLDVVLLPAFRLFTPARPRGPWAVFVMGMASGFVVGPCTAPVLGALLIYAASAGHTAYAALLLFVFAYGVGALLVVAGTFGGVLSGWPKAGPWMMWVKKASGAVLFVFSAYYFWQAAVLF